ncbi:MAG: hypothetical protein AAF614_09350 [Chloroflexota bacterium]
MQKKGQVATGGTILQLAEGTKERLWAVSPAGLFQRNETGWRSVRRGVPFWRLTAVLTHRNTVWAAGMPGGIIRSTNGGRSWSNCWVEQTEAPVVALALSANYSKDRVLLAATDGDGILRSTDGGRHWELSNFGLREFSVLDIVMAPLRGRYEDVFAITESGLYASPNGGRAWRKVELDQTGIEPLALAVSPDFAKDQTVCFGTAEGTLFVSTDAGLSWEAATTKFDAINSLLFQPNGTLLVGTMSGIHQFDLANHIATSFSQAPPVLTLDMLHDTIYAGLYGGLLASEDNGRSWQPDPTFVARRFVWYQTDKVGNLLAAGPDEGVWRSVDGGSSWEAVWEETAVLALTTTASKQLWVSTPEAIIVTPDSGQSWQDAEAPSQNMTALCAVGNTIWAGSQAGQLWRWQRGKWVLVQTPFSGQQILGLFSDSSDEEAVLTAVYAPKTRTVDIWRSRNNGQGWSTWFSQRSQPIVPQVVVETAVVSLGTYIYSRDDSRNADNEWSRQRVTRPDRPVTALARSGDQLFASFTQGLVASADGIEWQIVDEEFKQESVVAILAKPNSDGVFVGTADGRFYEI